MLFPMNTPIRDWNSQCIWVIGASSGIGAALAQHALTAGAQVAVSARRHNLLQDIASAHPRAYPVVLDVLEQDAWSSAYQRVISQLGRIDVIFFCAADYIPERSWEVDPNTAARTLQLNLGSVYSGLAAVLPAMLARGSGSIGIIASVAGYIGLPNASVYGPSKAGLINLAEILYTDLHPKGLNVYLINPGFVQTGLTIKNDFPMPWLQTPQQAAQAIYRGISAGAFEIHFPRRFTHLIKLLQLLPYRWRFLLFRRWFRPVMSTPSLTATNTTPH